MRRKLFVSIGFFLLLILNSLQASNNLKKEEPLKSSLGVTAGFGGGYQSGKFYTGCPCEFSGGAGYDFLFGIHYDAEFLEFFRYGLLLSYQSINIESRYDETVDIRNNTGETVNIDFRNIAYSKFNFFNVSPYLKFYIFDIFFIKGGFNMSIPIETKLKHEKELFSGGSDEVYILDNNGNKISLGKVTIEEGEFPNVNSPIYSIEPALGMEFSLTRDLSLSPSLSYSIPLTAMAEFDNGEKLTMPTFKFLVEFRYAIPVRVK